MAIIILSPLQNLKCLKIRYKFYSILFCTFIALNLCKADSKAQHQKSSLRNHLSIAVAKSSTTETPDRVYAKEGMPCGRDMILTFS